MDRATPDGRIKKSTSHNIVLVVDIYIILRYTGTYIHTQAHTQAHEQGFRKRIHDIYVQPGTPCLAAPTPLPSLAHPAFAGL